MDHENDLKAIRDAARMALAWCLSLFLVGWLCRRTKALADTLDRMLGRLLDCVLAWMRIL